MTQVRADCKSLPFLITYREMLSVQPLYDLLKTRDMRRITFLFCLALLPLLASAQVKIGYFSYQEAFESMPEYALAQANLKDLKSKYDAETRRVEDEFNRKYEEFLDGQSDFGTPWPRGRRPRWRTSSVGSGSITGTTRTLCPRTSVSSRSGTGWSGP